MVKNAFCLSSVVAAAAIALLMAAFPASAAPLPDNPIVAASTASAPDLFGAPLPAGDQLVVVRAIEPMTVLSGDVGPMRASPPAARLVVPNDATSAPAIVGGTSRPALWPPIAT
ncbi:MAG: hypothetical protein J0H82_06345 [Alphaproteobacteria bacterium]|jgi:hypothetical protein|nr:hypothetical protein [Alphaproteobacteria bacterium]